MKRHHALTLLLICTFQLFSCSKESQPVYKDKNAPVEKRVKDLVNRMTFEEKVLQLNQYITGRNTNVNNIGEAMSVIPPEIGSLIFFGNNPEIRNEIQRKAMEQSRLGIPILFGFDVIHGFRTVYPISLAQACSWNPGLVEQLCAVAAKEANMSGIDWTFSPMIDVARDPRWGRVSEGYGEDPYANSVFGVASVHGYQGQSLSDPYSIAACLKHYVGYGRSEGGRDYRSAEISGQSLWETYLPPYEACVKAGAATLMSAFNDISGVPASSNHYTLTEILKERWGHDGFVVSDWNSIEQLINQGAASDRKEAALKAFMAGVEMDMKDTCYLEHFPDLVKEKKIPMSSIDDAVARVLRVKFRLGLFDDPYTPVVDSASRYLQPESMELAKTLTEESMVLLKNKGVLPLSPDIKKIAVMGPMAKDKTNLLGSWSFNGVDTDVESVFEGLEKEFSGKAALTYEMGCNFDGKDESGIAAAVSAASKSDVVLVCLGEKKNWSGENASRSTIALPAIQEKLLEAVKKTGKPVVVILSNGRPLELIRIEPLSDAILEIWQPGVAGGSAAAGILSGRINPSGKLSITFPLTTGQIPTYYNMRQNARYPSKAGNYMDIPTDPLYWFGHGLSYSNYNYSEITVSQEEFTRDQKITAQVTVNNDGSMKGKESVLWYISDPACSITRPIKELRFFEKKEINPGEKQVYTFEIDPMKDLSYTDPNGKLFLEPGDFYIHVNKQKVKIKLVE